jgi:hypothetical protein
MGGLCDVWWCEPFPGDRSVGGAQVFGHHGVAGVVGKELGDVAVEGFARAVMDLLVGEVFAVVGVAQSCEGVEDELRFGEDGDRVGGGLRADGAACFGLSVEDEGVFGRCVLADVGAGGDGAEVSGRRISILRRTVSSMSAAATMSGARWSSRATARSVRSSPSISRRSV